MIELNKNLREYNTFRVSVSTDYFTVIKDKQGIQKILSSDEWKNTQKKLILGGGSNILFVNDFHGFILKNEIKGIEILMEDENEVLVKVGAGENWHQFVMWSVKRGLWGIENLVYIPGTVGAAPVQNIGAYGVEVRESIVSVEVIDLKTEKEKTFQNKDCDFDYRKSFFKKSYGKYIITHVTCILQKKKNPILSYGKINEILLEKNIKKPTSKEIADIIFEIRKSKLPEIGEIGTAGSFFKNPIVRLEKIKQLSKKFPNIKFFELEDGNVKVSAGWILDELGYRGYVNSNVGNYKNHALIVTHNGRGTGKEIYEYIQNIIKKVRDEFDITLEPEVVIIL